MTNKIYTKKISIEKKRLTFLSGLSIFGKVVLFFLLLATVFTFLTSKTSMLAGMRSMVVLTGSMEPTLPVGSIVYIQKQLAYNKDDVITFENIGGQNVTHRVTDIAFSDIGTVYTTKGDANKIVDKTLVPLEKVKGKVFFSVPLVGRVINFLNQPYGFLAFVLIPSLMLIGFELWNIKREIEKGVEERVIAQMQQQQPQYFRREFQTL